MEKPIVKLAVSSVCVTQQPLRMDLKQQLVIWKKSKYLMDNLSLSQTFCEKLVDKEIFTSAMMNEVQAKHLNIEKTLMMLTLLGSHGDDVYRKFLQILTETRQTKIAKELQRTEAYTHFGEMLPPQFTYFLDLSEFLRKYSHIALKLSEDGKHLLQSFIEGKIDMEVRKSNEKIMHLEKEKAQLQNVIERLRNDKASLEQNLDSTKGNLEDAFAKIEGLKAKNKEMENLVQFKEQEMRVLKHFRQEQEELQEYLDKEYLDAEALLDRSKSKLGENTKLPPSDNLWHMLHSQVRFLTHKLYHTLVSLGAAQNEEAELRKIQNRAPNLKIRERTSTKVSLKSGSSKKERGKGETTDIFSILKAVKEQRLRLETQLKEVTAQLEGKEKLLHQRERDIGFKTQEEKDLNPHESLFKKLQNVLEEMKKSYHLKVRELKQKHEQEVNDLIARMREMNDRHWHEIERYKHRVRMKVIEINKKEQLHRRLKNQIIVLENYQAKSMNAQVSVEECRKIVRGIIGEARVLKAIAEEREGVEPTYVPMNERERQELEKKKEMEEKKKKKKKKKKKFDGLADERLAFLAEKLQEDWKGFAGVLGVTDNRLDMLEIDHPADNAERLCFWMLKAWRDETEGGGKVSHIMTALQDYGREDLTYVVVPAKTLQQAKGAVGTGLASQGVPATMATGRGRGTAKSHRTSVPSLPQIAV